MPFLCYSSPFRSSSAVTEKTSHNFLSAVSPTRATDVYSKKHITPSLRAFPYCSNLCHFSTKTNIVRKRGTRHAHRIVSFTYYATRSPTKRTTLVGSLVLIVKLGARCGRRLAPPTPNKHIPFISAP